MGEWVGRERGVGEWVNGWVERVLGVWGERERGGGGGERDEGVKGV